MQDFRDEEFLLADGLSFDWQNTDRLVIEGRIRCHGDLFIDVETFLAVRVAGDQRQVRTVRYTYHAGVEGSQDRSVFRYDNFHAYSREGHADAHRKHVFDHATWKVKTPPEWIGAARWPHLSDVIEELRQWWETTGRRLDLGHRADDLTTDTGSR